VTFDPLVFLTLTGERSSPGRWRRRQKIGWNIKRHGIASTLESPLSIVQDNLGDNTAAMSTPMCRILVATAAVERDDPVSDTHSQHGDIYHNISSGLAAMLMCW